MNKTKKRGKNKRKIKRNKSRKRSIKVKGGDIGVKMHIFPRFTPDVNNKNDKNEMKVVMIPINDSNPISSGIKNTDDWIAYMFKQYPVIPSGVNVQTQTLNASYKKEVKEEVKEEDSTTKKNNNNTSQQHGETSQNTIRKSKKNE